MKTTGIADLKARLSAHLRAVRKGETIVVLDRKEPVARLVPIERTAGKLTIRPAAGKLSAVKPPGPTKHARRDVLEQLAEDRRERS